MAAYNREAPENVKPHVLHIKVVQKGWGAEVDFSLVCPYEGIRPCGVVEECHGSPKEAKKWGCKTRPQPQDTTPIPDGKGGYKYSARDMKKWRAFDASWEEWAASHVYTGGTYGHRTDECWHAMMIKDSGMEPEEILADFPDGMEIVSPMEVLVGTEGHGEEAVPALKLWKES